MGATEDFIQSLKQKQGARVGAMLSLDERDPDAAAENLRLGGELGLPANVVAADPAGFKRQATQKKASSALTLAPKTRAWLSDLQNGTLAKDDIDNLTWFEKPAAGIASAFVGMGDAAEDTVPGRMVQRGALRTTANVPQFKASAAAQVIADKGKTFDQIYEEIAGKYGPNAPASIKVTAQQVAKQRFENAAAADLTATAKGGASALAEARGIMAQVEALEMSDTSKAFRDGPLADAPDTLGGLGEAIWADPVGGAAFIAETAGEFLPVLVASGLTTAATRSPAAGTFVLGSGSFLAENAASAQAFLSEKGMDMSTPEAALAVLNNAELMQEAGERGATRGVIIAALDAMSGGVAGQVLAKSPGSDILVQTIAQAALGGGGEALATAAVGDEINWKEVGLEALGETLTLPADIVIGGRTVRDLTSSATSGTTASVIDEIDKMAAKSKLKARSPDKFQEALDAQGGDDFYVPAEDLREYFQAKDNFDDATLEAWGIDPSEFAETEASGGDIAISRSTYAARISGSEDASWFREFATMSDGEFSVSEAARFNSEVRNTLEKAFADAEAQRQNEIEVRASDVQVYDSVFSQLREAGRTRDVADNEARVWSSFWRTMGERYGKDPMELAQSMGVQIRGPQTPEVSRRRNDLDIKLNTLRSNADKALKPTGQSLLDFVRSEGGVADIGGDVEAMDAPKGVIGETRAEALARSEQPDLGAPMGALPKGKGLDELGRAAIEAGYFPEFMGGADIQADGTVVDEAAVLLEALQRAIAGEAIYPVGEGPDADLSALYAELNERGIDLAMSNDEIVAALEDDGGQTYDQDGTLKTDTPEFKAWFGDSKVVDADGNPLVVYHGTDRDFQRFDAEENGSATRATSSKFGFFFTSDEITAGAYANFAAEQREVGDLVAQSEAAEKRGDWDESHDLMAAAEKRDQEITDARGLNGQNVIAGYLSIQNPLVIDAKGEVPEGIGGIDPLIKQAKREGRDGVIIRNFDDAAGLYDRVADHYIIFEPTQIKSVNNRGTFDANDPRILYQFAGPQSETADLHQMATARDMLDNGVNAERVRRETGWFRGVDGKWRYEITDEDAKLTKTAENLRDGFVVSVGDVLDHDRLYSAYPDIRMVELQVDNKLDAWGSVNGHGSTMTLNFKRIREEGGEGQLLSTILHEVQHLIQRREGFARGGNQEMAGNVRDALKKLADRKSLEVKNYEESMWREFQDAARARDMVGYAQLFQDFERLIDYSKMDAPSGVFRHIRNSTNWWYSPIIQEDEELRVRSRELDRSLYALPKRGPKRNAFLREFAFANAQLLRDAVPADKWAMMRDDPRQTESMLKSLERESSKASKKVAPYHYELKKNARVAKKQADENSYKSPFEIYQLLAGEVEARNTQARRVMTEQERRETSPQATQDVDDPSKMDVGPDFVMRRAKRVISDEDVIVVLQTGEIETPMVANMDGGRTLYQPAYHGTPHVFDKFSTAAMGSGEGAQAFGWGMYFASRKGVAETYRKALAGDKRVAEVGGKRLPGSAPGAHDRRISDEEWQIVMDAKEAAGVTLPAAWAERGVGREAYIVKLRNISGGKESAYNMALNKVYGDIQNNMSQADRDAVRDFVDGVYDNLPEMRTVDAGRLYKVDVPEDSDLLAWDEGIESLSDEASKRLFDAVEGEVARAESTNMDTAGRWGNVASAINNGIDIGDGAKNITGKQLYDLLKSVFAGIPRSDRAASQWLLEEAGIPGHRFLDGGSRGVGEGSHNYVIYSDEAVKILEFEQGKRGSIVLPSGGLADGQTVINLFEGANLSTFLHESGHFFLEAFTALATQNAAPDAMKSDLAAIHKFLGVQEGGATPTLSTEQHETWARGFEAYLLEGKAPSLELADAFGRFKAWLTRIYRSIQGLNVKLTPEIREVMDRMLATDAEIAAARDEQQMSPMFTDQAASGMSDAAWSTYQRMARRSEEQASQALLEKTMAKVRREKEKWFKDERKQVRSEVETTINSKPEYRLIEMLANQQWLGSDQDVPDFQLDRKELVDAFGEGVLAELSRSRFGGKRAIYGNEGVSLREAADFFGFDGPIAMVEALQNATKRKDAIDIETDRVMSDRYGDPFNDGTIEEEAVAAIHSEQQANTVASEVRHLAGMAGKSTKNMTAKVFRQRARMMLGRMSVKEATRPDAFLAAERKASKRAEDAFARVTRGRSSGDALAAAAKHKEQQVLNHYLYMESRDLSKLVASKREKMRDYNKKTVRDKLDGGYIEQIDALLDGYDFRVRSVGQINRAENLRQFVERMTEEGRSGDLAIDERLLDESKRKHYTRLSVEELRGLFDTIENIDHMGRYKQKLRDAKEARDLAEVAGTFADSIANRFGTGKAGKQSKQVRNFFNLLFSVDTMMVDLDGEEIGDVYQLFKSPIDRGQALEQQMNVKMAESVKEVFSVYTSKQLAEMQKPRAIDGGNGHMWSKMEVISLALNTGHEDGRNRILEETVHEERKLTPDQLDATLSILGKEDWDFVQSMLDQVGSYWTELAAVHKRRTGTELKKVSAVPIETPFGTYAGGYYPISYDSQRSIGAAKDAASAWDQFKASGRGSKIEVRSGMTVARKANSGGRTLNYDLNVALAHMRDTIRVISMSEAVDNAARIVKHKDVETAFMDAGQTHMFNTLKLYLKDLGQGPIYNTDPINSFARIIKNNFTMAKLAFNFKTVALQATGIGQSAVVVGKKNMLRGYRDYLTNPSAAIGMAIDKSPFMAERQTSFQKDIYDQVNDIKLSSPLSKQSTKVKNQISKAGFWPMIKVQFLTVDVPTWIAAYDAKMKENGNEEKAIQYADRVVTRSQGSGLYGDRNALERGTISENVQQSDFVRLWTTLGSYMVTKMNRGYLSAQKAKREMATAEGLAQSTGVALNMASDMLLLYAAEGVVMGLAYAVMAGGDADEEDLLQFVMENAATSVVGGVPIVSSVANAFQGYGGGGVLASALEMPANFYAQAAQGENDKAFRRSLGDGLGLLTGLPSTASLRLIEGVVDISNGDGVPAAEMIFGSNPLTR